MKSNRHLQSALAGFLVFLGFLLSAPGLAQEVQTYSTPGSDTFTVPNNVTEITVEVWGAGGRGGNVTSGNRGAGGGGGGAYARSTLTVSPGQVFNLYVGAGSNSAAPGEDSWFGSSSAVLAKGGASVANNSEVGAAGGLAGASIGDTTFSGGNGANGGNGFSVAGGGGSSAGDAQGGADGAGSTGGAAPAGGGDGGDGSTSFVGNGEPGEAPGGGGGGARGFGSFDGFGGGGADGQVVVTYTAQPAQLVLEYRMEQSSWDGTGGEVEDTSGNGNDGTSVGGADTEIDEPAVPGDPGTCRYATFEASANFRSGGYIDSPGLSQTLNDTASMTFWIRTTQASDHSEAWRSPGIAGIEENGGTDDIFWGWIDPNGRIGISVGNDFSANQKSTAPINDGTWHHVALTWDRVSGDTEIYIDGALDQTGNTGTGSIIGNSYSGIGRIENTSGGTAPYYFDGELDEVRVYEGVLSAAQIAAIRNTTWPCDLGYDHIRLTHPQTGLTCSESAITVQACIDSDCTSLYADPVEIDLTSPASNWTPDPVTFTGSTSVTLQYTTPGLVTLDAAAIDPAADNPTRCFSGGVETACEMEFLDSGFVIDVPDHVADSNVSGSIAAVKADPSDPQQCVPGFDNETRNVNFWTDYVNPSSGGLNAALDGTAIATASPGTPVSITFDGNGVGSFTLRYPDVGDVNLNARYEGSGDEAGLVMVGEDRFIARPARFSLVIPGNPAATDENGDVFTAAGVDFEVEVAARNASDGITPNFGRETPAESVSLELSLVAPAAGAQPGLAGAFGAFGEDCDGAAATPGTACGDFSWPEVGIVALNPRLASGAYLGSADVVGTAVDHVGRFIPDHFTLGGANLVDRAGLPGCSASAFTYIGERFDAEFTLHARAAGGGTTANYEGAFAFLGGGDLNLSATPAPLVDSAGVGWLMGVGDASARLRLDRSMPAGPYPAYQVTTAPVDSDGVSLTGTNVVGQTALRFGRIVIDNAIGSELGPLVLPWRAEYWDGNTWLINEEDDCTELAPAADIELSSSGGDSGDGTATVAVGAGSTSIDNAQSELTLSAGVGSIQFTAPGSPGWVDALLGLDGNWPYLRDDLDDDGAFEDNPSARASFGLFDGNTQRIHIREIAPQ